MTESTKATTLPKPNNTPLVLERSNKLLSDAQQLIPGITQSMMKRPEQFAMGAFPVYLHSGEGALVRDVDGNEYIDYISGLAANTLGHNHPIVVKTIQERLSRGLIHSLPTEIEISTAKALIELIPGAEMARFFKTGTDATSVAVRLARYATGKEKIITVGYNGWHDHFMFDTPGVPAVFSEYTTRMPLFTPQNEAPLLDEIKEHSSELAAVLLSVPYNRCLTPEFVKELRQTCTEQGVLLVFDEVVTGFRLALGGAQEYFQVQADFVCLSKGIAAGMPLSAVAGPTDIMKKIGELQVSTTFGGEMLSLAVCKAVLKEYQESDFIPRIASLGKRLRDGINQVAEKQGVPLRVQGYEPIPFFLFDKDPEVHVKRMESFLASMAKRGILLRRDVSFLSGAHTSEQIDFTINAAAESLQEMERQGDF